MTNEDGHRGGYNLLGQWIHQMRGQRSLRQIAAKGGISEVRLYRLMKQVPLKRTPEAEVMQAIADGLEVKLARVHRMSLEAVAVDTTSGDLSVEKKQILELMDHMTRGDVVLLLDLAQDAVNRHSYASGAEHDQKGAK